MATDDATSHRVPALRKRSQVRREDATADAVGLAFQLPEAPGLTGSCNAVRKTAVRALHTLVRRARDLEPSERPCAAEMAKQARAIQAALVATGDAMLPCGQRLRDKLTCCRRRHALGQAQRLSVPSWPLLLLPSPRSQQAYATS